MLIGPQNLAVQVNQVRSRIAQAAKAAGRDPASVTLIAVSKAKPAEDVEAAAAAGVTDFGENYLKEALQKISALESRNPHDPDNPHDPGDSRSLVWHFIGHIQANKTRPIAEHFAWVHSIDRFSVARRLSEQRPYHAPPLNACIQVALVPEPTKAGIEPDALTALARQIAELPRLKLRGLMCVPPLLRSEAEQHAVFARLRRLLEELNAASSLGLDTLSMGMSADFEVAIAEGATHVRVGTALFGARP